MTAIVATFAPQRHEDLREGATTHIGWRGLWLPGWLIEPPDPYAGEWAMIPVSDAYLGFAWAPRSDLADLATPDGTPRAVAP